MSTSNVEQVLTGIKTAMINLGYAHEGTPLNFVPDRYLKYMLIRNHGQNPQVPYDLNLLPKSVQDALGGIEEQPTPEPTPIEFNESEWSDATPEDMEIASSLGSVDFDYLILNVVDPVGASIIESGTLYVNGIAYPIRTLYVSLTEPNNSFFACIFIPKNGEGVVDYTGDVRMEFTTTTGTHKKRYTGGTIVPQGGKGLGSFQWDSDVPLTYDYLGSLDVSGLSFTIDRPFEVSATYKGVTYTTSSDIFNIRAVSQYLVDVIQDPDVSITTDDSGGMSLSVVGDSYIYLEVRSTNNIMLVITVIGSNAD